MKLCSFGSDQLKKCDSVFQKSKANYQDNTCYTIDLGIGAKPFAPNGLNLLLDLKHMPSDEELPLKIFFHEHGTFPDVLRLESTVQIIKGRGNYKIGLSLESYEVTENFAKMSVEKRQCLLPQEMDGNFKTQCLVNQVHQFAEDKCLCLPILMGGSLMSNLSNLKCSHCFRQAIQEAKTLLNATLCPSPCVHRMFKPMISWQPWKTAKREYGKELASFLFDNPMYLLLDQLDTVQNFKTPVGSQAYLNRISKSFTYVEIFFKDPQKTVIIQDAKVTETDMVSNIGGTIGIFLGLSTISFLDFIIKWFSIVYRSYFDKAKVSIRKARKM